MLPAGDYRIRRGALCWQLDFSSPSADKLLRVGPLEHKHQSGTIFQLVWNDDESVTFLVNDANIETSAKNTEKRQSDVLTIDRMDENDPSTGQLVAVQKAAKNYAPNLDQKFELLIDEEDGTVQIFRAHGIEHIGADGRILRNNNAAEFFFQKID